MYFFFFKLEKINASAYQNNIIKTSFFQEFKEILFELIKEEYIFYGKIW